MNTMRLRYFILFIVALSIAPAFSLAQDSTGAAEQSEDSTPTKPKNRADSLRAIAKHLGLGEGSAIADVGAGGGKDTLIFAEIVGASGTVYAEEIVDSKVKLIEKRAKENKLTQVRAVLGRDNDPRLPEASADLAFMHYVYHHFAKPRKMLRGLWKSLKPGGYLVVVDQVRGTLRDWVPREIRTKKHHWTSETTVVREAREEGFLYVECAEQCWHGKDVFVLVFQRPQGVEKPAGDPDPFFPLNAERVCRPLLPLGGPYQRPAIIALGEGRKLITPILEYSSGPAVEIVLEEWATQKEERPPLPKDVSFPSVLTEKGDPKLGSEPIDVVFFLDSYHLLFHGKTLLAKLHERLAPEGCVYIIDRVAKSPLSRRDASHRRKICPETVKQEMGEAGFSFWCEGPSPAADRFLLVFGKANTKDIPSKADPLVGGPTLGPSPGEWLKENYWRLRGLKVADGRIVALGAEKHDGPIRSVAAASSGTERWAISGEKLLLTFEKKDDGYLLMDCQSSNEQ